MRSVLNALRDGFRPQTPTEIARKPSHAAERERSGDRVEGGRVSLLFRVDRQDFAFRADIIERGAVGIDEDAILARTNVLGMAEHVALDPGFAREGSAHTLVLVRAAVPIVLEVMNRRPRGDDISP